MSVYNEYRITKHGVSVPNLQANFILERVHQTIRNMIRTFQVHSPNAWSNDPWPEILLVVIYIVHAIIHTMNNASPTHSVFR